VRDARQLARTLRVTRRHREEACGPAFRKHAAAIASPRPDSPELDAIVEDRIAEEDDVAMPRPTFTAHGIEKLIPCASGSSRL
jgi:hypothetical protein